MKMLVSLISYVRYTRGGVCDPEGQLSFLGEFWNPVQFSHSVVSDSETPRTAAHQASLSITNSRSLLKTHVHRVGDAIQPSHPLSPLLLLP